MRKMILVAALLLTACGTQPAPIAITPTPVKAPTLPEVYAKKAPRLNPIVDKSLKGLIKDSLDTTQAYNSLRDRYNGLIDFYGCVVESINNEKVSDTCPDQALK